MKAITASLDAHKQMRINRHDLQEQLVTKVMAQVQASLGEEAIQDMCDQIMSDIVDESQRDLCLQVTKATIGKLVTKMVAAHLNHQFNKNATCHQTEITNGQQDQLVSMVLKAVQATLHLQVMKEMHEQFVEKVDEVVQKSSSSPLAEAAKERLKPEVADQQDSEEEAGASSHVTEQSIHKSDMPVVTEVVGLVRDALHLQVKSDICDHIVSAILEEYVPD